MVGEVYYNGRGKVTKDYLQERHLERSNHHTRGLHYFTTKEDIENGFPKVDSNSNYSRDSAQIMEWHPQFKPTKLEFVLAYAFPREFEHTFNEIVEEHRHYQWSPEMRNLIDSGLFQLSYQDIKETVLELAEEYNTELKKFTDTIEENYTPQERYNETEMSIFLEKWNAPKAFTNTYLDLLITDKEVSADYLDAGNGQPFTQFNEKQKTEYLTPMPKKEIAEPDPSLNKLEQVIDQMVDWESYELWAKDTNISPHKAEVIYESNLVKAKRAFVAPAKAAQLRALEVFRRGGDCKFLDIKTYRSRADNSIEYYAQSENDKLALQAKYTRHGGYQWGEVEKMKAYFRSESDNFAPFFDSVTAMIGLRMGAPNGLEKVYESAQNLNNFDLFHEDNFDVKKNKDIKALLVAQEAGLKPKKSE